MKVIRQGVIALNFLNHVNYIGVLYFDLLYHLTLIFCEPLLVSRIQQIIVPLIYLLELTFHVGCVGGGFREVVEALLFGVGISLLNLLRFVNLLELPILSLVEREFIYIHIWCYIGAILPNMAFLGPKKEKKG